MKIARFRTDAGLAATGVVDGDNVIEMQDGPFVPRRHRLDEITLLPPIGDHAKIICVGFNYAPHAQETGVELPTRPTLFTRFPDSVVGHDAPILRPGDSDCFDWEGEVAVVIGRPARRVPPRRALDHIAGFTCFADNSIRDWQQHSSQATAGKNWSATGACGPWLVTPDELGHGADLKIRTMVNGIVVQDDTTAHLTFSVADLLAYVSTFTPLEPGDVIATGTPAGIGHRKNPPQYLAAGDVVEVEVSGIGTLRNEVVEEVMA
ncbi:fumarylacetoacetate hydrolase family protein [Nocardia arthritidis]|uniref:fumarylacetoacetate hydrolase family protein n=1 Tax=Nocardia arthritidis TaxID=228602 RepID=UPI0007A536E9|nr:fumarylacetoacetate hydrolase family protein [Nocardia arthritidis]